MIDSCGAIYDMTGLPVRNTAKAAQPANCIFPVSYSLSD